MRRVAFIVLAVCGALVGCHHGRSLYEEGEVPDFQDEVGTAKVSVVSVTPIEDAVGVLCPDFQLTSDEALARVALPARAENEHGLGGEQFIRGVPQHLGIG